MVRLKKTNGCLIIIVDGHRGTDFYLEEGVIVLAPEEGLIRVTDGDFHVFIDHPNGTMSI